MKRFTTLCLLIISCLSLHAQDYPNWPADKPETGFIEDSQSKEIRSGNAILPQEIDMQDKMRTLITDMMQSASQKLNWAVTELSEYTNNNGLQNGGTPYNLRSPRGLVITFQFIVNKDSLQAWKKYQLDYSQHALDNGTQSYDNVAATTESPLYKRYQDSVNYYMNLYTTYTTAHQSEGADLFTKDKHPKYYQQKQNEFIDKMTAMTQQVQDNSGMKQMEGENALATHRFRNNTVVQVSFKVNSYVAEPVDQSSGSIKFTSVAYPVNNSKISRLFSIPENQENSNLAKWKNIMMILLGNFLLKPNEDFIYHTGFNQNGQGDEHTPKKIKSDQVQSISINIYGNKTNVEKIVKLIDVDKLNHAIVKK